MHFPTESDRQIAVVFTLTIILAFLLEGYVSGLALTAVSLAAAAFIMTLSRAIDWAGFYSARRVEEIRTPPARDQTARIAHDLRTQISIVMLQLDKIGDPRIRQVEADLRQLTKLVDGLSNSPSESTVKAQ